MQCSPTTVYPSRARMVVRVPTKSTATRAPANQGGLAQPAPRTLTTVVTVVPERMTMALVAHSARHRHRCQTSKLRLLLAKAMQVAGSVRLAHAGTLTIISGRMITFIVTIQEKKVTNGFTRIPGMSQLARIIVTQVQQMSVVTRCLYATNPPPRRSGYLPSKN